jgi:hypothetical protein
MCFLNPSAPLSRLDGFRRSCPNALDKQSKLITQQNQLYSNSLADASIIFMLAVENFGAR